MNKQTRIGNVTVTANTFYNGHVDQHVNPYGVLVQNGEGVTDDALVGTYVSFVADASLDTDDGETVALGSVQNTE